MRKHPSIAALVDDIAAQVAATTSREKTAQEASRPTFNNAVAKQLLCLAQDLRKEANAPATFDEVAVLAHHVLKE